MLEFIQKGSLQNELYKERNLINTTRGKPIAAARGETAAILLTYLLVSRLPVVLK